MADGGAVAGAAVAVETVAGCGSVGCCLADGGLQRTGEFDGGFFLAWGGYLLHGG